MVEEWNWWSSSGLVLALFHSPVLFRIFSGNLFADPAKSHIKVPNCTSKHPQMIPHMLTATMYEEAVTT